MFILLGIVCYLKKLVLVDKGEYIFHIEYMHCPSYNVWISHDCEFTHYLRGCIYLMHEIIINREETFSNEGHA